MGGPSFGRNGHADGRNSRDRAAAPPLSFGHHPDLGRNTMQPSLIYVIGAIGKTGGRGDNALGHAESKARLQESSDGKTAV
jgi:hypothetical protein